MPLAQPDINFPTGMQMELKKEISSMTRIFLTTSSTITAVFSPIDGNNLINGSTSLGNSWW